GALGRVALAELLDAARRVHDLLLARVERMAGRANLDMQRLVHGRAGSERVAAAARYLDFGVLRMDVGFHGLPREGRAARRRGRSTGVLQRVQVIEPGLR